MPSCTSPIANYLIFTEAHQAIARGGRSQTILIKPKSAWLRGNYSKKLKTMDRRKPAQVRRRAGTDMVLSKTTDTVVWQLINDDKGDTQMLKNVLGLSPSYRSQQQARWRKVRSQGSARPISRRNVRACSRARVASGLVSSYM